MPFNNQGWRPIDAPQMDIRGLAIAGNQFTGGFDRLASMLQARQGKLESDALDAAKAHLLTIQDPEALKAAMSADPSTYGKNVNVAQLLEFGANRQAQLTDQAGKQEDLLNKQALSKYGEAYGGILNAAVKGDPTAMDQIKAAHANDPMFGRFLAQTAPQMADALDKGMGQQETVRSHKASEAYQQGELGLDQGRFQILKDQTAFENKQRDDKLAGAQLGYDWASRPELATLTTDDARIRVHSSDAYKQLSAAGKAGVDATFDSAHKDQTAPTQDILQGMTKLDSQIAARTAGLDEAAQAAENQQRSPLLDAVRAAPTLGKDLTMDKLIDGLDSGSPSWTRSGTRNQIEKILNEVPGASLGDVQAAANQYGFKAGTLQTIDPFSQHGLYDALKAHTSDIVKMRDQGYGQNVTTDVTMARAGFEAQKAQLAQVRSQLLLYKRAGKEPPQALTDKLDLLLNGGQRKGTNGGW